MDNLIIVEAVYTCIKNFVIFEETNNRDMLYFTEGSNYIFERDIENNQWLITINDYGISHIVSELIVKLDENDDIISGDWEFDFIDEYFELKEITCRGEI